MRRPGFLLLALTSLLPALPGGAREAGAQELAGHGGPVRALALTADGGLASAGFDRSVILWTPAAGRARAVLRWHAGAVNALAALPDGRLASAGEDGRIALWRIAGDGAIPREAAPERVLAALDAPVAALAVSPDGRRLAAAVWDGTARVWVLPADPAAGEGAPAPRVLEGHAGPVNGVAFRGDGTLATAGYDGTVRLWPAAPGAPPRLLGAYGVPQNALVALPDGGLAAAGADGTIRLIAPPPADGGVEAAGPPRTLSAGARPLVGLAVAPDGRTLAAASLGGSVALWRLPEGRLLRTLEGPGHPFWSVLFTADGTGLWTGGADRRVRRWDVATGRAVGGGPAEAEPPEEAAAFAAAAAAEPHGARVWRACAVCHALTEAGGASRAGPHLAGLFGRRMGGVAGYPYSERLRRGDIVWTRETVADLFTRGPEAVTPGTRMPEQTVGNAEDLSALLRFLELATR